MVVSCFVICLISKSLKCFLITGSNPSKVSSKNKYFVLQAIAQSNAHCLFIPFEKLEIVFEISSFNNLASFLTNSKSKSL